MPAIIRPRLRAMCAAARRAVPALVLAVALATGGAVPVGHAAPPPRGKPKAPPAAPHRKARAARAPAHDNARNSAAARDAAFRRHVDALLAQSGLRPERVGLLLYSGRERHYLYERNIHQPFIAASNAKLLTTYAALRLLSPDYRWRTRFYLVEEHDDAGGAPRQGLVVQGTGDPTLTSEELQQVAWQLRSRGVRRLEGGIYFDGRRFDDVNFPDSWGDVSKAQPWFAPVSPFIVDRNVIEFLIATRSGGSGFDVFTDTPGFTVVSSLEAAPVARPALRVDQDWRGDTATFTVQGALAPADEPYHFSAAVERPRVHFYRQLRAALERAGVRGAMPLRLGKPPSGWHHLHTVFSPPLGDVIEEVNKHSSNLAAEVLLRTMGLEEKRRGVSAQDGLAVMMRRLAREFPEVPAELNLVDGSGLSRDNRVSPLVLVRLLNRVRNDFSLRPEFINSLPVVLTDGTLQYRNYPWRMQGRLRAKTGTLAGVSNLSGYLQLDRDVVVFSFLINDGGHPFLELQDTQDRIVTDLYDALQARAAGKPLPSLPAPGAPRPGDTARKFAAPPPTAQQ